MKKIILNCMIAGALVALMFFSVIISSSVGLAETKDIQSEGVSADSDHLTILSSELLPFAALRDGNPVGFGVEIVYEIMRRLERADSIEFDDWDIVYKRVLTEPNTVLMPPSRTLEREALFKWVGPLIPEKIVLFARKDSGLIIKSPKDAKKVGSIATVSGYASEKLLKAMGFTNLASQRSPLQGPDALKFGRVDLWINSNITMKKTALAAGVDPDLFEPVFVLKEIPSYLAFSKSVPDHLVNQWQAALDDMKQDGTWERIVSGWVPADLLRIGSPPRQLAMEPYLALANVILACFLSIAIFSLRSKGSGWLSLLLLIYGAHSMLRWGMFTENHIIMVYFPVISFPAVFLLGSVILLYTNEVLFDEKKPEIYRHLIAPGIALLAHLALILFVPEQMTVEQIKNQTGIHQPYTTVMSIIMPVYVMTFIWTAFFQVIAYKKRFKDNFSNDMIRNTRWLYYFVLANAGIITFTLFAITYCLIKGAGIPFTSAEDIVMLSFLLFFLYYLIVKPKILPMTDTSRLTSSGRLEHVSLPAGTITKYVKKLEKHMAQTQAFLDQNISVRQISEAVSIPQHYLSLAINTEFNQNFYNYVNTHRIRYAENLLKTPDEDEESILMIAYRSGFQSIISFNKAFRSLHKMMPSEYRDSYISGDGLQKRSKHDKTVRLLNRVCLFVICVITPHMLLTLYYRSVLATLMQLASILALGLAIFLNSKQLFNLARIWALLVGNLHIFYMSLILGLGGGTHFYFSAAIIAPLFFYTFKELRYILFFSTVTIALAILVQLIGANLEPIVETPDALLTSFFYFSIFGSLMTILFFVYYFYNESNRHERSLREANRKLLTELSERQAAQAALVESERLLAETQRVAHVGSWELDVATSEIKCSVETFRIIGREVSNKLMLDDYFRIVHPEDLPVLKKTLDQVYAEKTPYELEVRYRLPDGTYNQTLTRGQPVINDDQVVKISGSVQDIAERKRFEEELKYHATTDMLTGIANRRAGMLFLDNQVQLSKRNEFKLCVCFVDVNGLKGVNDTYGHDVGDKLIQITCGVLQGSLRESDFIFRLGGDEFLMIFPQCSIADATEIWKRVEARLDELNNAKADPYTISLSHGFAESGPEKVLSSDELISIADEQMYKDKH